MAAPLFKWPGGKRWLAPLIQREFWSSDRRLIEPFAGGAAVFFAVEPKRAVLGDMNPEVVNCYRWVRDDAAGLIKRLSALNNSADEYYRIRSWQPSSEFDRAVRFLYLTRLSFNGIYRENTKGQFNVPYGGKTHLAVVQPSSLLKSSALLKNAELVAQDFQQTAEMAEAGDLVYLDPPYTTAHNNNGFVKYNAKIFSWQDQERLAQTAAALVDRGCLVIASNAHHDSIHALYSAFEVRHINRFSVIGAKKTYRRQITESLFVSHERGLRNG